MKKKIIFTILFISLGCLLLVAFTNEIEKINVKREEFPQSNLTVEKFYRGTNHVLTITTKKQKTNYAFIINGKTVATVSDEKSGNGFFESIMIFDPDTGDFDEYIRSTNGLVTPIDSSKLEELKVKFIKAAEVFEKMSNQLQATTNQNEKEDNKTATNGVTTPKQ
jgi:hypothetical protein